MPMRRISTGLTRIGFDQDPSPLTEGMLHAASTLGELWPRLKQIEMEKKQHQDSVDERKQRYEQESQDRASAMEERKQARTDALENQKQNHTDYVNSQNQQRSDAHAKWAAGFGLGPDSTDADVASHIEEGNRYKRNMESANNGVAADEGQLWQKIASRSQEEQRLNQAIKQRQIDKPDFAPRSSYNQASGWHKKNDGTYFKTDSDGQVHILDPATNVIKGPEDLAKEKADAEAAAATKAADDKLVTDENSQSGLWTNGRMPWNDSRDVVLARARAKQANANRPADQLWPSTPSNLPPGVTPDDPHGMNNDPATMDDNSLHDYLIQNEPGYAEAAKDPRFNRAKALQFARSGGK